MQSFDDIYVIDLHGNSKKKERSPDGSKDENVFDIQQGVAIGVFVKRKQKAEKTHLANVHHAHLWGLREVEEKMYQDQRFVGGKYYWLGEHDLTTTEWTKLAPESPFYLFVPQDGDLLEEYEHGTKITEITLLSTSTEKSCLHVLMKCVINIFLIKSMQKNTSSLIIVTGNCPKHGKCFEQILTGKQGLYAVSTDHLIGAFAILIRQQLIIHVLNCSNICCNLILVSM